MTAFPVERTYDWHRAVVGNVSTEALALVLVLSNRMNADGTLPRRFTPSIETMSQEMGYAPNSRRAIVRAMKELEVGGFLLVERGGGRRATNTYRATTPTPMVAESPQGSPESVADRAENGGRGATHPTHPNTIPNPASGSVHEPQDAQRRAGVANEVLKAALSLLPDAEADVLLRDLGALKHRDRLRDTLAALVDAGHRDSVIAELTAVKVPGTTTAYEGCQHPGRVAWGRLRDLSRLLALAG